MARAPLLLVLLASCGGLSGCKRGPAPVAATLTNAHRIISAGGANTEILFALGLGDHVVAVDSSSFYPPDGVKALPKVGYQRSLSAEGVLSLHPDLLLVSGEAGPPAALAQVKSAGVNVELVTASSTVEGAEQRIRQIGRLFARPGQAEALVVQMKADLQAAQAVVARHPGKPRVLAIYARGASTAQVAGRGTPADAMIALAGGVNCVDFDSYKPITAEAVVGAKPDVVLMTARGVTSIGGSEAIWALPGLALTPAGRARRVIAVDDLLLLGFGPRLGQAALAVAQGLGPVDPGQPEAANRRPASP